MIKRALTAIAATGICLASAGNTSAGTFCVEAQDCSGTPSPSLQSALDDAQKSPDPDRIEIGSGSFFPPTGSFHYSGSSKNKLTIAGAGAGETHLFATTNSANVLALDHADVSGLDITGSPPDTQPGQPAALELKHGTATDVKLTQGVIGALLEDGGKLVSSQVDAGGTYAGSGVEAGGTDTAVVDTVIASPHAATHVPAGGSLSVVRSRTKAETGVMIEGGSARVTDSLLVGPAQGSSGGVYLHGSGNSELSAVITNTTIVGRSPVSDGVLVEADDTSQVTASVENSAVVAGNLAFTRFADKGSADLSVQHSSFDPAKVHDTGGAGVLSLGAGNVSGDPGFVNALAGDFHLRSDSPLIDKGTASPAFGLGASDLDGVKRSLDGDGDGKALPDIGAFEAPAVAPPPVQQPPVPQPPVQQPPATGPGPVLSRVTLTHKRFKVHAKATTFRFKLSMKAAVTIAIGKRKLVRRAHAGANRIAFGGKIGERALKRGRYTARLTARDAAGHASKTRTVSFRIA